MLTKRQLLEHFLKEGNCADIYCRDCPYANGTPFCDSRGSTLEVRLTKIGAMAILHKNRKSKSKSKKRVFNPDKILTCVTADKARVGMKGYFGDDLAGIKNNFENNILYELSKVYKENYPCRFINKRNEYALFYPIDEEEE
ncbi:MAG: hypothetical protein U0K95_04185 [Eubacterium sp.]|nr:hypothetical protein [Eubacterium sp.]